MDFTKAINDFKSTAQTYCSWLEAEGFDASREHYTATKLIAELYAAALSLPDTEPCSLDAPLLQQSQREMIREKLRAFPFQYYWEIYEPVVEKPEEAVCGDITDDLVDIYFDVKEGLLVYPTSEQAAVLHWRTTFGFHWGRHATSALHALHNFTMEQ